MPIVLVLFITSAVFISMKGSRVLGTLFAIELGASPFAIGMLFALHGLCALLFSVYVGRIADRIDNRVLLYWGLGGLTATMSLPYFMPVLPVLYIAVFLGGIANMLIVVASQNLIGLLSAPEQRTRNFSYYSLSESLGGVAGPVMVGIAIDAFSHATSFVFMALTIALAGVALVVRRSSLPHVVREAGRKEQRAMSDLLRVPALRNALITNGLVMAGLDLFTVYMPVYAHGIGLSATVIGLILGAFGVAAFITRLAIPPLSRRFGERALLVGAFALAAFVFIWIPLTVHPLLLGLAAFVLGLGLGCGQPLSMILTYNAAPPGRSAEAMAMRFSVSSGSHVFIPPLFGVIGSGLGMAPIFWTCAVLLAAGSFINRRKKS